MMDATLHKVLESVAGSHIPYSDEGCGYETVLNVPVAGLQGRSFMQWVTHQPIKMGGLSIRSQAEVSPAAFVAAVEQTVPTFWTGVCPQLTDITGGEETYGQDADHSTRWRLLVQSGCRCGRELEAAWNLLQTEAQQCTAYLGCELEGVLAQPVMAAGNGSTTGSTRRLVTEQREQLRGAVITRALQQHGDQRARPCIVWPQLDKCSAAWLLALPGPETGLSSAAFSEALAAHLCMPSPACAGKLGMKVARQTLDAFGDAVMAANLPGDQFRIRHDALKMTVSRMCQWARLPCTVEVFGLFSHLIPQEGLSRMESGRKRQGIVPDFRLGLPSAAGGAIEYRLAELKMISCCPTRYAPGDRTRAVDRRARLLQGEYARKARACDRDFTNTPADGGPGPVERHLASHGSILGLVVGRFGELSEDVHALIQHLAVARMRHLGLHRGRPGSASEMGTITGQIRRQLSVAAVRAQAELLLTRLHQVGEGSQASRRRQSAARGDERMRCERRAQWLSWCWGRSIVGRGRFMV